MSLTAVCTCQKSEKKNRNIKNEEEEEEDEEEEEEREEGNNTKVERAVYYNSICNLMMLFNIGAPMFLKYEEIIPMVL